MPYTIGQLKRNIGREFKKIPKEILKSTFDDFYEKLKKFKSNGGHAIEK